MIQHIVFDFGGVLLNLDYNRSYTQLSEVMKRPIEIDDFDSEIHACLIDFEKGLINEETFLWKIQNLSVDTPQPRAIIDAWNAMLLGWNPARFEMLDDLKKRYHTYILSNTNSMHIDWVYRDLKNTHGITNFEERFFKKVYYSHVVNMRKPDAEIYNHVINDANIPPSEVLFIDDNLENVQAAQSCGIHAVHHNPAIDIIDCIDAYLKTYE